MTILDASKLPRIISWFSAGAASAVATFIASKVSPYMIVAYCDTGAEHPDNKRFLRECCEWIGVPIVTLKSPHYQDIWDVFEKTRYLVGVKGARCSTELKKLVRRSFQEPDDLQIFGFTSEEIARADRFKSQNIEVNTWFPLIEEGLTKADCKAILKEAGIDLPTMYKLGYKNNNCIGCVKGQQGYWNKIRRDFPEVFNRMAKVERDLNVAINKSYAGDGKRKRVFLDELDPKAGKYEAEPDIECNVLCNATLEGTE